MIYSPNHAGQSFYFFNFYSNINKFGNVLVDSGTIYSYIIFERTNLQCKTINILSLQVNFFSLFNSKWKLSYVIETSKMYLINNYDNNGKFLKCEIILKHEIMCFLKSPYFIHYTLYYNGMFKCTKTHYTYYCVP